jgi:hypothetical protein
MTHKQVESILSQSDEETDEGEGHPYELWNGKDITICLWFGDDNRLEGGRGSLSVPGMSSRKEIPLPAGDGLLEDLRRLLPW